MDDHSGLYVEKQSKVILTPMIRFFYKNVLWEIGHHTGAILSHLDGSLLGVIMKLIILLGLLFSSMSFHK